MLQALGIGPVEEQVYAALVSGAAADAAELAARVALPEEEVERALGELESSGLLDVLPGPPRRLCAAPPDVVLHLMALRRMDELRKTQLAIAQLAQAYGGDTLSGGAAESVESIRGSAVIAERVDQLQRAARAEIQGMTRGLALAVPADANPGQADALRAGVRYRAVYERSSLDLDASGTPMLLEQWATRGEEMRVAATVPLKLLMVDNRMVMFSPRDSRPDDPVALVTRVPTLLEALGWIFERVWDSAMPVPSAAAVAAPDGPLPADDQHLLSLLLAGYTDQAIGAQLNVSMRTVQRRVQRLFTLAGVQTRIQLGWQAAQRNWI